MSDSNAYISNGTCYSAAGKKLDGSFIPCGNDAYGHQTCCGAGDNCLADNSCFGFHGEGYGSYLTYMAGCSDPDYKASTCPDKKIDQPWIALTLCDNSDGAWAPCSQEGNPTTLRPGSYCSCTDSSKTTVQFKDSTSLTSICSLPRSTGQSIQFFAGHIPTSVLPSGTVATTSNSASGGGNSGSSSGNGGSSTPSQTGSSPSSSNAPSQTGSNGSSPSETNAGGTQTSATGNGGTSAAASSSSSASSPGGGGSGSGSGSSGLSSGAKVGIGVGAGVGGLVLVLFAIAAFFLHRRHKRQRQLRPRFEIESSTPVDAKPPKHDPSDHIRDSALSSTPTAWEADGQPVVEADGQPVLWNLRSELEGSPVIPKPANRHSREGSDGRIGRAGNLSPVAELPGSEGPQGLGIQSKMGDSSRFTQDSQSQGTGVASHPSSSNPSSQTQPSTSSRVLVGGNTLPSRA